MRKLNTTTKAATAKQARVATVAVMRSTTFAEALLDNASFDTAKLALANVPTPEAPVTIVPAVTKPEASTKSVAREAIRAERVTAHFAAAKAVSEFYNGASKPFKASGDTFQPLNFGNAKPGPTGLGTPRQAALLLAMLTYSAGNIQPDGTFTRGHFRVPAHLVFDSAELSKRGLLATSMLAAQPESGCLGNMLARSVHFVTGPRSGAGQREQTLRIDFVKARAEIVAFFGDKHTAVLDVLAAPVTTEATA